MTVLFFLLIFSTALILGNEFSVATFIHPSLTRSDHKRFLPAIQVLASCYGRVMPPWMGSTTALHLVLTVLVRPLGLSVTRFLIPASLLWMLIVIFSVLLPVPINNRVQTWNEDNLPTDWEQQRRQWDIYNGIRVFLIALAFGCLLLAFGNYNKL